MIWLNKIETILSIITSIFAGTIIWTGDTNINIKVDSDIQKRYTELFNNFTFSAYTITNKEGYKN